MANDKEIRGKIASVKNTQKITRAMEMVATSKMRKAQDQMKRSRPYADKILQVIGHLANAHPEYRSSFMEAREEIKSIGIIVVSSDRGLCGGLNNNLFRDLLKQMQAWEAEGKSIELCVIGTKAATFFKRIGGKIVAETSHLGDTPTLESLIGTVKVMLDAYEEGRIDQLMLSYNQFVNTMTQAPNSEQLLPLVAEASEELQHHWDYLYEPDAKEVLDQLMMRYIEAWVYRSAVENLACEQAARMVAMKSASDNASTVIDQLELDYNKARQAAITQEISEIVGGAAAV